jgi:carbonic anhydrase
MKKTLATFALVSLGWQGVAAAEGTIHWTYTGDTGPEHWAELSEEFEACRLGKNQSPINIISDNLIESALPPISLDYSGRTQSIINNGHTLQVNVTGNNTLVTHDGSFHLKQFHFHSPSEHRIDGESFPLEAHFVHENENGELAVVSLLFRSGEFNQGLVDFGKAAPTKVGQQDSFERSLAELMKEPRRDINHYYRYNGSLTTPPCTEGLRWFVIPVVQTISEDQVATYIELIGADARGPQPINARIVLHGK